MIKNRCKFKGIKLQTQLLLSFCFGFVTAFAQAPVSLTPLLFIGLSGLYAILSASHKNYHGFFIGYAFTLGYFGMGLYWIGNALLVEDNPYWWAWPLAVSGLPLILGIFGALACYFYLKFFNPNKWHGILGFVCLLSISEWARGNLFTGFPWNLFAYSWSSTPEMMQSVSIVNIYDLTFLTIFWASLGGYLIVSTETRTIKIIMLSIGALSFAGFYIFGQQRLNNNQAAYNPDYQIILVQPNIPQSEKWKSEKIISNFESLVRLSENTASTLQTPPKASYIIWPETSFQYSLLDHPRGKEVVSNMLRTYSENSYVIGGTLRYEAENDFYFNSIILLNKSSETLDIYNKNHLVPFGEYMPFSAIIDIAPIVGFKGFESGTEYRETNTPDGLVYFPLVCYEIIFPELVTQKNALNTDIIVNTTNDGWYGISAGPYQHLAQAQFRAIETGIPVARVANTGFSAIIDPYGIILEKTQLFESQKIISLLPKKISITSNFRQSIVVSLLIYMAFTCIFAFFNRKEINYK